MLNKTARMKKKCEELRGLDVGELVILESEQ